MSDAQAKLVLYRSYLGTVQRFHDSSTRALGGYARVVDVVLNGDEVELRIETLHSAEPSGESWVEEEPDECAAHLCESAASDIAAAILPDAARPRPPASCPQSSPSWGSLRPSWGSLRALSCRRPSCSRRVSAAWASRSHAPQERREGAPPCCG